MGVLLILSRLLCNIAFAGADGVGVNARSWASAAKAGMKQADAPQEKARPCTFQQIVNINRARGKFILFFWGGGVLCFTVGHMKNSS